MSTDIERLAEWMGWKLWNTEELRPVTDKERERALIDDGFHWWGQSGGKHAWQWNPYKSWDDWRMVEEKIMENDELWADFMDEFKKHSLHLYMKANLETRCTALLKILDE